MENWKLPAAVAKLPHLTGCDKVLYAYLLSTPDAAKHPIVRTMSVDCGMDMWTVRHCIQHLEEIGLIETVRSGAKIKPHLLTIKVRKSLPPSALKAKKRLAKKKAKAKAKAKPRAKAKKKAKKRARR